MINPDTPVWQLTVGQLQQVILDFQQIKSPEEIDEVFLTKKEVRQYLNQPISDATFWRWGKSKYLVPVKIGGINKYKKSDIDKFVKK